MCVPVRLGNVPFVQVEMGFEKLTPQHAVKLVLAVRCLVEEASFAVGEVLGYGSMKSASCINGATIIFLDSMAKLNDVVEDAGIMKDTFTPVLPPSNPAKVTISNAPQFIKNEMVV